MHLAKLILGVGLTLVLSRSAYGQPVDLTQYQMKPWEYNAAKILQAANKLISAGEPIAYQSLLAYRPETEYSHSEDRNIYYEYVTWLCVLVYDPKPGSTLPPPLF